MATQVHPVTGVTLNEIGIHRKTLEFEDAVTAWLLHLQGDTFTDVVQMLGTNANRVGEVFRGDVHPDAQEVAVDILRGKGDLLV